MTAVEWLFEQVVNRTERVYFLKELEQAKEMEKQQMKIAQMHYSSDVVGFKTLLENQFEDWYNQTFKNTNK